MSFLYCIIVQFRNSTYIKQMQLHNITVSTVLAIRTPQTRMLLNLYELKRACSDCSSGYTTLRCHYDQLYTFNTVTILANNIYYNDDSPSILTPLCFLYFQGECRKLFCPAGTLPYHGECVFPFSHIVGAALEIHFRIELPELTQQPRFVLHASSLHKVEQEISSRIQGHCTTCQSVLYRTSDRMLVLKVVTMTTEFCKMSHLLRIRTQLTEEEIRYKVTLFGSVYDVKMKPLITSFPSETTELSSLTGNASCSAPVRFDTAFISEECQQIKLT